MCRTSSCRMSGSTTCPRCSPALQEAGLADANAGLITDIISCPGLDYCTLATARSIPIARRSSAASPTRSGSATSASSGIKISGCINACGHHHVGGIGILGLDKAGSRELPDHARRRSRRRGDAGRAARAGHRRRPGAGRDRADRRRLSRPAHATPTSRSSTRCAASGSTRSRPRSLPTEARRCRCLIAEAGSARPARGRASSRLANATTPAARTSDAAGSAT